MRINNGVLALVMLGCTIMGGIIGGGINDMQRNNETQAAWDRVTVVADGTLVANPAYYADHPEELAEAQHVRIISNDKAAIELAFQSER